MKNIIKLLVIIIAIIFLYNSNISFNEIRLYIYMIFYLFIIYLI